VKKEFKMAPLRLYKEFGKYFPFSTVDVIIRDYDGSFILTKRIISPYVNKWHLPGGLIRKGEKLQDAVKRSVRKELGLEIRIEKFLGTYENPISTRHDISHVFVVSIVNGKIKNDFQSKEVKFFKKTPKNTISYHVKILQDAKPFLK
jgi:ADP-ribose pyrophosphatase YjhB (NUDIX family)